MTRPGRERYDDIVDAITAWHPHCRASKIFGMPCVKRAGRVVFGFSRTGMVFKLTDPDAHAHALPPPPPPGGRGCVPAGGGGPAGARRRLGGTRLRRGGAGSFVNR